MPENFVNISKFLLFIFLFAFASCQTQTEKDTIRLKQDAQANAELSRVNQMMANGQYLMKKDMDALQQIREKYPHAPVARQILQAALIKREDWQTAADFINQVPDSERTYEEKKNLANIYLKLGRYEDTLQTVKPLRGQHPANAELISTESSALFYLGKYEEAGQLLDQIWNEIVGAKKTDEMTMRGMIYFYAKDYPKAVETLNKAIEFNPNNVAAYNALTRVYSAQGDTAKAEEYTQKVQMIFDKMTADTQKKVKFVESAKQLEEAFKAKRFDEVVILAQKMIPEAENADKAALYQFLANAYQAQGKFVEAQNALAEAEKVKNKK